MEQNRIEELIAKYNEGVADPSEIHQLELLIEDGIVDLTQLRSLNKFEEQIFKMATPVPSMSLDEKFRTILDAEKRSESRTVSFTMPSWDGWMPRLALAASFLIAGFIAGYWIKSDKPSDVEQLTQQVTDLKEMMMLSLLEKESASERLKAVSLSTEMDKASRKVTEALLQTLNNDSNTNVRLAALEALTPYSKDSQVREELVRSIAKQESPLVQVELAELMGKLQEKKSVKEFERILKDDNTPVEVKNRIKESINVLI